MLRFYKSKTTQQCSVPNACDTGNSEIWLFLASSQYNINYVSDFFYLNR